MLRVAWPMRCSFSTNANRTFPSPPGVTYLVHGEPPAQQALKQRIERELAWNVHIPDYGERVDVAL